ncbi:MAG: protein kinase, partial [Chloroflexia bacterium]
MAEIGRGGFATVYSARDLRHDARVAIKVLRPELAPAVGAMRFTREVQITARLQHPNILPVLDSGEAAGMPWYVMPFVDGETLAARIDREHQLPIDDAVRLVAEVADGLAYAHAQGFIHRDIKPENILLSSGHAMIADFGVATALDAGGVERLTGSGVALGTVLYMSPEQAAGDRVDGRSDIYALGCVLYQTLTGSPPFSGPTPQAVMARHAIDAPPSIRSVRSTVSPALEAVILKAMAKTPADRFRNAAEFREAMLGAATAPFTVSAQVAVPPAPTGRNRPLMAGVAAVAVLALGAAAWWSTRPRVTLDENKVVVFPMVLPAGWNGEPSAGEDVATLIGSAVDGAGPLRWIDGWQLLDGARRNDPRTMTDRDAADIARAQHARYMLTGRLTRRGDSATVFLSVTDVAGDSTVGSASASSPLDQPWRAGLAATTTILPRLIRTGVPDVASAWAARSPTAVAHFLLGESAFRRVQLDDAERQFALAVAADSTFGLAAIRGAQASTWNHHQGASAALIDVALRGPLSPAHAAFAQGYRAYLAGEADSSIAALQRAIAIDSTRAFVWMQLSEVYAHLIPQQGDPERSIADA